METPKMDRNDGKILGRFPHWQIIAFYLMIYDIVVINVSYFMALWLRFDIEMHFGISCRYILSLPYLYFGDLSCIRVYGALQASSS